MAKEMEIEEMEQPETSKGAMLRKAILVAVGVFFFGVALFIGIAILIARFATKGGPGPN